MTAVQGDVDSGSITANGLLRLPDGASEVGAAFASALAEIRNTKSAQQTPREQDADGQTTGRQVAHSPVDQPSTNQPASIDRFPFADLGGFVSHASNSIMQIGAQQAASMTSAQQEPTPSDSHWTQKNLFEQARKSAEQIMADVKQAMKDGVGWIGDKTKQFGEWEDKQSNRAVQFAEHALEQVDKLHGNGDQAVLKLVMEGWLTFPWRGFNVGPQVQYGYEATVVQVGDGPKATYKLSFGKDWVVGAHANTATKDLTAPGAKIKIAGSLGLEEYDKYVDSSIMTFDNKADVLKALHILERLAAVQSAHDGVSLVEAGLAPTMGLLSPYQLRNPLVADPLWHANLGDALTRNLAPTTEELKFLHAHVTGTGQLLSIQGRLRGGLDLPNFWNALDKLPFDPGKIGKGLIGNDFRFDGYNLLSRTANAPRDGRPGTLTYSQTTEFDVSSRKKLKWSGADLPEEAQLHHKILSKLGISPQILEDHTQLQLQVSATWNFDKTDGFPETEIAANFRMPAQITFTLSGSMEDQWRFVDLTRTDWKRVVATATVKNPDAATLKGIMSGDFRDIKWESKLMTIKRDGLKGLISFGVQLPKAIGGDFSVSPIYEFGSDVITEQKPIFAAKPSVSAPAASKSAQAPQ